MKFMLPKEKDMVFLKWCCKLVGNSPKSWKKSTSMTFIHLENGGFFFAILLDCRLFRLQSSGKWSLIHREMIYKHFVVITHVLTFTGKGDTPKRYTCGAFWNIYICIYWICMYTYHPCCLEETWGNHFKDNEDHPYPIPSHRVRHLQSMNLYETCGVSTWGWWGKRMARDFWRTTICICVYSCIYMKI